MGKRYNWTETRAKWSVNKSGAKVVKENSKEERSSVNKDKKQKSHDGYSFLVASQFCFGFFFCPANRLFPKCNSRNVSNAMPRNERGREKAATFFLSKMAEGWEKAAPSREEERCTPSCSEEGWAIQPASLPRFPLLIYASFQRERMAYNRVVVNPLETVLGLPARRGCNCISMSDF